MLRKIFIILSLCLILSPALPLVAQSAAPQEDTMGVPLSTAASEGMNAAYTSFLYKYVAASTVADTTNWVGHQILPGESLQCLSLRSGVMPATVAQINHIVNPALVAHQQTLHIPADQMARSLRPARHAETRVAVAMQENTSLWDVLRHNPTPLYEGQAILLSGSATAQCWPYPVVDMTFGPQPVVRGRTLILALETAEPTACEVTYADLRAPCYTADGTHLYALLGLSALIDPGQYKIGITLFAEGLTSSFDFYIQVDAGRYGFQFISPPASLNQLMDATLMQGEMDYLETWREIRTPERQWDFPLAFPLERKFSVSADYGDRRSYGGLVDGYHSGVDYRAWTGVSVLAPADGVVLMAQHLTARGNAILIDHGWGLVTGYWHLSQIDVEVGQNVTQGDVIGKVGNTGLSTGSHLHWEVWVNGVSVDGKQWLNAQGLADYTLPTCDIPLVEPGTVETGPE